MRHSRFVVFPAIFFALFLGGCSSENKPKIQINEMGQRVNLGHLVYTVFETQWLPQIGTGPAARAPKNRFFLVRLTAVNGGSEETIIPNMTVEDDQGNSYEEVDNGDGVPQWIGLLRSAKPAQSVDGFVIFDAPPKHYKLKVTDENNEHPAFIDIPLTFNAETPDQPMPNQPVPPPPVKK